MNDKNKAEVREIVRSTLSEMIVPSITTVQFLGLTDGRELPDKLVEQFGVLLSFKASSYGVPHTPHQVESYFPCTFDPKRDANSQEVAVVVLGQDIPFDAVWVTVGDLPGGKKVNDRNLLVPFVGHSSIVYRYLEAQNMAGHRHIDLVAHQREFMSQKFVCEDLSPNLIREVVEQRGEVLRSNRNLTQMSRAEFQQLKS